MSWPVAITSWTWSARSRYRPTWRPMNQALSCPLRMSVRSNQEGILHIKEGGTYDQDQVVSDRHFIHAQRCRQLGSAPGTIMLPYPHPCLLCLHFSLSINMKMTTLFIVSIFTSPHHIFVDPLTVLTLDSRTLAP